MSPKKTREHPPRPASRNSLTSSNFAFGIDKNAPNPDRGLLTNHIDSTFTTQVCVQPSYHALSPGITNGIMGNNLNFMIINRPISGLRPGPGWIDLQIPGLGSFEFLCMYCGPEYLHMWERSSPCFRLLSRWFGRTFALHRGVPATVIDYYKRYFRSGRKPLSEIQTAIVTAHFSRGFTCNLDLFDGQTSVEAEYEHEYSIHLITMMLINAVEYQNNGLVHYEEVGYNFAPVPAAERLSHVQLMSNEVLRYSRVAADLLLRFAEVKTQPPPPSVYEYLLELRKLQPWSETKRSSTNLPCGIFGDPRFVLHLQTLHERYHGQLLDFPDFGVEDSTPLTIRSESKRRCLKRAAPTESNPNKRRKHSGSKKTSSSSVSIDEHDAQADLDELDFLDTQESQDESPPSPLFAATPGIWSHLTSAGLEVQDISNVDLLNTDNTSSSSDATTTECWLVPVNPVGPSDLLTADDTIHQTQFAADNSLSSASLLQCSVDANTTATVDVRPVLCDGITNSTSPTDTTLLVSSLSASKPINIVPNTCFSLPLVSSAPQNNRIMSLRKPLPSSNRSKAFFNLALQAKIEEFHHFA